MQFLTSVLVSGLLAGLSLAAPVPQWDGDLVITGGIPLTTPRGNPAGVVTLGNGGLGFAPNSYRDGPNSYRDGPNSYRDGPNWRDGPNYRDGPDWRDSPNWRDWRDGPQTTTTGGVTSSTTSWRKRSVEQEE